MFIDSIVNSKQVIEKALDGTWIRNQVISQNIANVDTPGYKKKTVSFEDQLRKAVESKGSSKADVSNVRIQILDSNKNLKMRIDENNVDVDTEMAQLAKNTIQYEALLKLSNFSSLKTVINGSRQA